MKSMRSILVAGALALLLGACGETLLEEFTPKDQNEADIKALLVRYSDAVENKDMVQFLSCFHTDCRYVAPRGAMTKEELSEQLTVWMPKWDAVKISDIRIDVKENAAAVKTKEKIISSFTHEFLGLNSMGLTYFDLVRENDEWLIVRLSRN